MVVVTTQLTVWPAPLALSPAPLDFAGAWNAIFSGELPAGLSFDALTMATPLDTMRTGTGRLAELPSAGLFSGSGELSWRWANLGFLLGGLWLLGRRRIAWQIPAGFLGALCSASLVYFLTDPATHPTPLFHLLGGATMLGAFFIATDPVSSATTPLGRLIHGAGIGFLVFVIRTCGGYPDGVAFGVLLLNLAAPTLDRYTRPRIYGHPR